MANHNELGKLGEKLAVNYLKEKGYIVLEVNYMFEKGEIDIIAVDKEVFVMVEVKTRKSNFFGDPQDFVTHKKVKQLIKVADSYLIKNEIDAEVRFDIIAVLIHKEGESIEHFIDAFYPF